MSKHIKKITSHPLISGSIIVFAGSFFINGLNYLFNLLMGRFLSVADYGVLISIVSFISVLAIFQTVLSNLFTKFAAGFSARKDVEHENAFISYGFKVSLIVTGVFFLVLLLLYFPLSVFLKISISNPKLLAIAFLSISVSILYSFPSGIFQGQLKFLKLSVINVLGSLSKILFGLLFIFEGFGVMGGLLAVFLSYLLPYVLSLSFLLHKLRTKSSAASAGLLNEFKKVSAPFLLASLAVAILQSTDVMFARHYLSATDAGRFAALSLMGKAIFYITSPIYLVFFPLIIHKKERGEKTTGTLLLAGSIILLSNLFFASLYSLYPSFIIKLFFPHSVYQSLTTVLGLYSVFISILSVAYLLHSYFLSIGKTQIYKINWASALLFILLLFFLHDSIYHIILSLIISSLLLLVLLFVYYFRNEPN